MVEKKQRVKQNWLFGRTLKSRIVDGYASRISISPLTYLVQVEDILLVN
jgi:hypothetical protein